MRNKKKTILIFGISSAVGEYFYSLFKNKYNIIGTYFNNTGNIRINKKKFFKINLLKEINLNKKVSHVIHCAHIRPEKSRNKKQIFVNNIKITKNIMQFCIKKQIKKYVFLSSISVYKKNKGNLLTETSEKNPNDIYGKSKLISENIARKLCSENNISFFILRLSSLVSKKTEFNIYSNLIKKMKKHEKIQIFNPQSKFNNLIHTEYVCKIIFRYIEKIKKNYLLNISSINQISLIKIIYKIKRKIKYKKKLNIIKNNKKNNIIINCKKALKAGFKLPTVEQSISLL